MLKCRPCPWSSFPVPIAPSMPPCPANFAPTALSSNPPTSTICKPLSAAWRFSGPRTFVLPCRQEQAIMTDYKRSILCIDDEERDLMLQRATFEAAGFQVAVARDLGQVQQVLARHAPDAVVLDYR